MTTEHKVKNAIKWIDYLSTTEDPQGKGCLGNDERGYCCLGIGCKVLNIEFESSNYVSIDFATKVGLCTGNGDHFHSSKVVVKSSLTSLTSMNDCHRMTFKEIADNIKNTLSNRFLPEVAELLNKHYKR